MGGKAFHMPQHFKMTLDPIAVRKLMALRASLLKADPF
jgi:hypothetical protein